MAIQIDTLKVQLAAANISRINAEIESDYSTITSAVQKLKNNWKGNASDYSANAIRHIEQSYGDARFSSVNQLVSFLKVQVNESYEVVESSAVSAADAFK